MKLNIARQPLVPAFLTLVALTVLAMWKAAPESMSLQESADIPTRGILAIASPEELLGAFQSSYPIWAKWIAGLLMLYTGTCLGRISLRYNLYAAGTCLAIPLFGILGTSLGLGNSLLVSLVAMTLLALAVKNYARAFRNGYAFDAMFRASLYLGILPLVRPASLPLILLLPLSVLLFPRTLRETVVALAGLLLPVLTFCYINWGAGGDFLAPLTLAYNAFTAGSPLEAIRAIPLPGLIPLAVILVIDLAAILYFLADSYSAGNRSRTILFFQIGLLLLLVPTLLNPVAKPVVINLLAVPSALLYPFLFVRIHRIAASILYLLLLAGSILIIMLQ